MVRPVQEHSKVKPLMLCAVDVVMEFGPERRRPEAVRLQEVVPDAAPTDIAEAIRQAHAIEARA